MQFLRIGTPFSRRNVYLCIQCPRWRIDGQSVCTHGLSYNNTPYPS